MTYPDDERALDAPEADAAEQATPADPGSLDDTGPASDRPGLEVPEWDAQEQSRAVPVDDDYR